MSAQGQSQGAKVGFSSSVGVGNTHATANYNRTRGATGPTGQGSPNFTGYFKPRGTPSGPSNVSALAAAMGGMTLGQGRGGRRNRRNKTNKKNKNKNKNKSRKH